MKKSATELMQEIIFSAVVDSILALKSGAQGMPNALLRTLNSIHANATFQDLPPELQASITASVRSAFTRLLKEGYSVAIASAAQAAGQPDRRPPATDRPRPRGPGGPRGNGPGRGRGPGQGTGQGRGRPSGSKGGPPKR